MTAEWYLFVGILYFCREKVVTKSSSRKVQHKIVKMKSKNQVQNPFSVTSYLGSDYFCDREDETKILRDALSNGRNITLISPRKIGKTGLIHHFFHSIPTQEAACFYVDIYKSRSLSDFTKTFAEAVLTRQITPFSKRIWNKIMQTFASLRPVFSVDSTNDNKDGFVSGSCAERFLRVALHALLELDRKLLFDSPTLFLCFFNSCCCNRLAV